MNRDTIKQYISEKYGADGEKLWAKYPGYEVFRRKDSKKWFALLMNVSADKLDIATLPEETLAVLDILNVKCDPALIASFLSEDGFYPAYHMNKTNWISADINRADDDKIKLLLDISYSLTAAKTKKK